MVSSVALPLMEHFFSIQGEGFHTGMPAYFLRIGGCEVGCVWCDVKESWEAARHAHVTVEDMAEFALWAGASGVVVTGGEPLMYNMDALCRVLKNKGMRRWLETSGAYPLSGEWDWICVSPKKFRKPLPEMLSAADELKVIVFNKSDFGWAEEQARFVKKACKLYLQPEWDKKEEMMPAILEYIKRNPQWRISLQTHKYIGVP